MRMVIDKKATVRSAVIFMAIMLFFTLFSKTIHYYLTPKVSIYMPQSGEIANVLEFQKSEVYKEGTVDIRLPQKLGIELPILSISAVEGGNVRAGDVLVTYDTSPLDDAIQSAQMDYEMQKVQSVEFNHHFQQEKQRLKENIASTEKQISKLEKKIGTVSRSDDPDQYEALSDQLKLLEATHRNYVSDKAYLEQNEILNGQNRFILQKREEASLKKLQELQALKETCKEITSKIEGTVVDVAVSEGFTDSGGALVARVAPNNTDWMLRQTITNQEADLLSKGQVGEIQYLQEAEGIGRTVRIPCEVVLVNRSEDPGNQYILAKPTTQAEQPVGEVFLKITIEHEIGQFIIPNNAFAAPDKVFVLIEKDGFWGKELFVQERIIKKGLSDLKSTSILSGLSSDEYIITGWDRPIKDGQCVMLPLE